MRRVVFASVAGLAFVLGCSSQSGNESSSVPLDAAPEILADAVCAAAGTCYQGLLDVYLPGEDCKKRTLDQLTDTLSNTQADIDAGKVVYRGNRLRACAAAVKSAGCDFEKALSSEACTSALDGTVKTGGACRSNQECAGSAFCDASGATCPGQCAPLASDGGVCETDDQCAMGLSCSSADQRCHARSTSGACDGPSGRTCAPGSVCLGASDSIAGTCSSIGAVFAGKVGQACDLLDGPLCATGLSCIVTAAQPALQSECAARVGSGAACSLAAPDQCPADEFCKVATGTFKGTCTSRPRAGEACAVAGFSSEPSVCAPYARCEGGTCRPLSRIGANCGTDATCLSDHCFRGKCAVEGACQ